MSETFEEMALRIAEEINTKYADLNGDVLSGFSIEFANQLRTELAKAQVPEGWVSTDNELPSPEDDGKVLVTNNIGAKDAFGHMSHVWAVYMIHKESDGIFTAFDEADRQIMGITHWFRIPSATPQPPAQPNEDVVRICKQVIMDFGQICGLIDQSEPDKAFDYCRNSAEWYADEIAAMEKKNEN